MKDKLDEKLQFWQSTLSHNQTEYESIKVEFDPREDIVKGDNAVDECCENDVVDETYHVRNLAAEMIEAQIDANIPAPKVTPRKKEDEKLAKIIEDMIKDELDRMPFEILNDMAERTVPIQGGIYYLIEWDNSLRTNDTIGDLTTQLLHPKQVVPQDGVYTSIDDMDYFFVKLSQTKEEIKRRYGVDVKYEAESEPEIRGVDAEAAAKDLVTQYTAYYRNKDGGIGKFSWVNDTVLEDLEDCQARRLRRCKQCGAIEPLDIEPLDKESMGGNYPGGKRSMELSEDFEEPKQKPRQDGKKVCPYCGGTKFEESQEDYEEVYNPKISTMGVQIPGEMPVMDEAGMPVMGEMQPTKIPYYNPRIYPIVLQKSISMFGQLLGESDIDKIKYQQNTANRLATKMLDKLLKAGSFATMPTGCEISTDNGDIKVVRVDDIADLSKFNIFNMEGNIEQDLTLYSQVYEEGRQAIGITDSYQGRRDTTATSGKAKEFSAQQAAGRLESKRRMKEAAYAQIYEALFKFKLAYSDEPRNIIAHDETGGVVYETFDRYDFLKQDEAGEWYWNDQFLFSCDNAAPLSNDRTALWQETRMNLQEGAFGDPTALDTLILFWSRMDVLHYPFAKDTKEYLQKKLEQQQMMQQQQMVMQQQQMQQQAMMQQEGQKEMLAAKAAENILKGTKNGNKKTEAQSTNKQTTAQ